MSDLGAALSRTDDPAIRRYLAGDTAQRTSIENGLPADAYRAYVGRCLTQGIETVDVAGVSVRVFCVAKTVADCFKFRNKVGLDVALEALREAWHGKWMTMDELWHYAQICRVANVIRPYIEALGAE